MLALVKYKEGSDGIEIRDVPKPVPGNKELLVKVMGIGICGSDIHIMKDEFKSYPPVVMGHEYTGIVEDVGKDVKEFNVGDQIVSMTQAKYCGVCTYCRNDLMLLCANKRSIGSGIDGAMADYIVVPADTAYKLPDNFVGKDTMVLAEPLACTIRAVIEKSNVQAGDIVLVSGPGTIGQLAMMLAKIQGAFVIVSGLSQDNERLEASKKLGADVVVNNNTDLFDAIKKYTKNGVDVAYECAGAVPSLYNCIKAVKKAGNISQVGLYGKEIPLNIDKLLLSEINLTVSYGAERSSWDILLRLIKQNKLNNLEFLISERLPLQRWKEAFDKVINREGFKIVLCP